MPYLILDSNSIWNNVKRLVNKTRDVKGVTGTTVAYIAREIVLCHVAEGVNDVSETIPDIKELSDGSCPFLLRKIACGLAAIGKLSFYDENMVSDINTCREMYRVINDIRLGGEKEFDYNADPRLSDNKLIMDSFVEMLKQQRVYDRTEFICEAVELMKDDSFREKYIRENGSPKRLHFNRLSFMEERLEEQLEVSDAADVYIASTNKKISFYKAYGIENEIRYIVNKIKEEAIPFGDVNIFYSSEKYEGYISSVLEREGIRYSFTNGRTPSDNFILLIKSIIKFAGNSFSFSDYKSICRNHLLSNVVFAVDVQSDAQIGWGREVYMSIAELRIQQLEKVRENKMEEDCTPEEKEKYIKRIESKIEYYQMMKALADIFKDEKITVFKLYSSIISFMSEYTNKKNRERGKGLRLLKDTCGEINTVSETIGEVSIIEAVETINEMIDDIIVKDSEAPNVVAVKKIGGVSISERSNSFFTGLSFSDFTSKLSESPVMSDDELQGAVEKSLILASDRNTEKEQALRKTIDRLSGNVYMSYSYVDTAAILENSPADIFIEYLERNGMSDDQIESVGFVDIGNTPMQFVMKDYREYFMDASEPDDQSDESVNKASTFDKDSDSDEDNDYCDKECDEEYEDYDIDNDSDEYEYDYENEYSEFDLDDENNGDEDNDDHNIDVQSVKLSATGIQLMLNCNRQYLYKYIYGFPERADYEVAPDEWLGVNVRGTYAHEILQLYMNKVADEKGKIPDDFCEDIYKEIVQCCYEKYLKLYPARSIDITKAKNDEYYDLLKTYLQEVHKDFKDNGWRLLCTEGIFKAPGLIDDDVNESLEDEDTKLEITIDARMDRVDYKKLEDGKILYRIVDYKTGSRDVLAKKIEGRSSEEGPMQIQHELYRRQLEFFAENGWPFVNFDDEEIIVKNGSCDRAEYHFIFEENPADRLIVRTKTDDVNSNTYTQIIDTVSGFYNGARLSRFEGSEADERCKYCDYSDICGSAE